MNMIDAVKSVLSQYTGFSGRARRSEYWYWILATTLASLLIGAFEGLLGLRAYGVGPISLILSLVVFIPGLAVSVRRLHDVGKSGWWLGGFYLGIIGWYLLLVLLAVGVSTAMNGDARASGVIGGFSLIFLLGVIIYALFLLFLLCQDSHKGPNKYGPNPKNQGNYEVFE